MTKESLRPSRPLRFLVAAGAALALGASLAAQNVPDISFDSNADLLQTPKDVFVGEIGGVGANSKGQIFVYTRTGHPYGTLGDNRTFYRNGSRLFLFDQTGKFVREWGQDVYGFNAAIGLRVDPQDNVWTIDEVASQIVKFDSETLKKILPEASTLTRAAELGRFGTVIVAAPVFGMPEASVNVKLAPPSIESSTRTFAQLMGALEVFATFQFTV